MLPLEELKDKVKDRLSWKISVWSLSISNDLRACNESIIDRGTELHELSRGIYLCIRWIHHLTSEALGLGTVQTQNVMHVTIQLKTHLQMVTSR